MGPNARVHVHARRARAREVRRVTLCCPAWGRPLPVILRGLPRGRLRLLRGGERRPAARGGWARGAERPSDGPGVGRAAVLPPLRMRAREQTSRPVCGGRGASAAAMWSGPSWSLRVGPGLVVAKDAFAHQLAPGGRRLSRSPPPWAGSASPDRVRRRQRFVSLAAAAVRTAAPGPPRPGSSPTPAVPAAEAPAPGAQQREEREPIRHVTRHVTKWQAAGALLSVHRG